MIRSPGQKPKRRQATSLAIVLLFALAVLYSLPVESAVWAGPQQARLRQTIPTLTPTPIPSWIWIGRAGGNPADYAPSGMPDFDQTQASWHDPEPPSAWTHCGPVSVADSLWWLDSLAEPGNTGPSEISDGHDLISSFGAWDDHDEQNVVPVVDDLATRLNTQTSGERPGTDVTSMVPALGTYLAEKNLQDTYTVTLNTAPTFDQLYAWVQQADGIVLLLGFWEDQGDRWVYLGGHYVAVAGAEPFNRYVALSDPFRDAWEAGEALLGRSPVQHVHPHDADLHNDAQYVSHDAYPAVTAQGPGGGEALDGYVPAFAGVPNFIAQNVPPAFEPYLDAYGGSPVISTKMDYALVISRARAYTLYLPVILKGRQ
jgi:hypothetical protein